jgi:hypothetical protein
MQPLLTSANVASGTMTDKEMSQADDRTGGTCVRGRIATAKPESGRITKVATERNEGNPSELYIARPMMSHTVSAISACPRSER